MSSTSIQRAALGQIKTAGALYNISRDQFVPGKIFLNPEITSTDAPFMDLEYTLDKSTLEKLTRTKFNNELKLSLPLEITPFKESFEYFNEPKNNTASVQALLKYKQITKKEEFDPFGCERNNNYLSYDEEATHVAIGVTWGACVYIVIESKFQEDVKNRSISGILEAQLKKIIMEVSGKIGGEWTKKETSLSDQFNIRVLGDFPFSNKVPTSIEEISPFLKEVPELIKNVNNGKGVPVEYELYPLTKFNLPAAKSCQNIESYFLIRIEQINRQIEETKLKLDTFYLECNQVKEIIQGNLMEALEKFSRNLKELKEQFKKEVKDGIMAIQEKGESNKLEFTLTTFEDNQTIQECNKFMDQNKETREKFRLFAFMKKNGVKLEESFDSLNSSIFQSSAKQSYLFLYCEKNDNLREFQKNLKWFRCLIEKKTQDDYLYLIDRANVRDSQLPLNKSCLYYYLDGELISKDYAATNFIQIDKKGNLQCREKEVFARHLSVPCPKSCNQEFRKWICTNCKETVCVDQKENLHCKCCQICSQDARFHCCEPCHGSEFSICKKMGKQSGDDIPTHLFYQNGDLYIGEFRSKTKLKRGILYYQNGSIFEGEFINNQITGKGKLSEANGNYYEGEFVNNRRTGKGKCIWKSGERNGDQYEGDFLNNKMTGEGTYTWANGKTYTGKFLDNKMVEAEKLREVTVNQKKEEQSLVRTKTC